MADETQTDATNSNPASQTDANVTTEPNSSTTDQTAADATAADAAASGDTDKPGDPLDGGSILGGDDADKGNADAAKEGDDKPSLTGAPEGDYELTGLPEGTVIDKDAMDAAAPVFKELNLSNEGASKVASVYADKVLPAVVKSVTDNFTAQVVAQRAAWDGETRTAISGGKDAAGADVKADPIYGGKPYDAVVATSAKAIDRFGGADFRTFLNETGLGNHPAMVRFAYQAGALISEDTDFVRNGDVPNTPRSREEKYYPKSG